MYNPKYDKSKIDAKAQPYNVLDCGMRVMSKKLFDSFVQKRIEYAKCYVLVQEALSKTIGDHIDEDFILRLQSTIMPDYSGYRAEGAAVFCADKLVYRAPIAQCTKQYLCNLIEWFNKTSDLHILIKAAVFHYEFVKIHPFFDGNGRTVRLIVFLMLASKGYDFKKCILLIDYLKNNKKEYYDVLTDNLIYKFDADSTKWIEYFCSVWHKINCN